MKSFMGAVGAIRTRLRHLVLQGFLQPNVAVLQAVVVGGRGQALAKRNFVLALLVGPKGQSFGSSPSQPCQASRAVDNVNP